MISQTPTEPSDEQLIQQCKQELPYVTVAFELLLKRYEARVFQACQYYLGAAPETEEATQDIWMKVFNGLLKFRGEAAFTSWLHPIIMRVCATYHGKIKKAEERRQNLENAEEEPQTDRQPETMTLSEPLTEALGKLKQEERHILVLRHVFDLSLAEIGANLGLKLSASKMRLYRAEARLREVFRPIEKKN